MNYKVIKHGGVRYIIRKDGIYIECYKCKMRDIPSAGGCNKCMKLDGKGLYLLIETLLKFIPRYIRDDVLNIKE